MKRMITFAAAMLMTFAMSVTALADAAAPDVVDVAKSSPIVPIAICVIAAAIVYGIIRKNRRK